jgi:hypothetical protein
MEEVFVVSGLKTFSVTFSGIGGAESRMSIENLPLPRAGSCLAKKLAWQFRDSGDHFQYRETPYIVFRRGLPFGC